MKREGKAGLAFAILCVCVAAIAFADPGTPPTVEQFASPIQTVSMMGNVHIKSTGYIRFDEHEEKQITSTITPFPLAQGQVLNQTTLQNPNEHWHLLNGVCRELEGHFFPMFGWLRFSRYNGTDTIRGVTVEKWFLGIPSRATVMTLYVADRLPYRWVIEENVHSNHSSITQIDFTEPSHLPVGDLPTPPECQVAQREHRCPNGQVENLVVYVEHSVDDWHIASTTLSDLKALAASTCLKLATGEEDLDRILSKATVQVNTAWGQVALCNDHICFGGNPPAVGHSGAFQLGGASGQCSSNDLYGNWYSLPRRGICRAGQDNIDEGPCTWQQPSVAKSIAQGCVVYTHNLLAACNEDNMQFPFTSATEVLRRAFEEEAPDDGGCRDMSPPERQHGNDQHGIPHRGDRDHDDTTGQHHDGHRNKHQTKRSVKSVEDTVDDALFSIKTLIVTK